MCKRGIDLEIMRLKQHAILNDSRHYYSFEQSQFVVSLVASSKSKNSATQNGVRDHGIQTDRLSVIDFELSGKKRWLLFHNEQVLQCSSEGFFFVCEE